MVSNALLLSSGGANPIIAGFAYSVSRNTRQGRRIPSSAMNSLIQENWGSLRNVIRPSISLSLSIRTHIFHHPMRKLPVLQRRSWNRVSLFSCLLGKSPNNCPPGGSRKRETLPPPFLEDDDDDEDIYDTVSP